MLLMLMVEIKKHKGGGGELQWHNTHTTFCENMPNDSTVNTGRGDSTHSMMIL